MSKRKQMDVNVIFFDSNKQEAVKSFIGSHFMGHASAEDTSASLKEVHKDLDLVHNLVQVSMDGPNVDWKTVEIIEDHQKIQNPNCPNLIVIGSCGLHVVHGAYGAGQNATDWSLDKFLKAIYSYLKRHLHAVKITWLQTTYMNRTNQKIYLICLLKSFVGIDGLKMGQR